MTTSSASSGSSRTTSAVPSGRLTEAIIPRSSSRRNASIAASSPVPSPAVHSASVVWPLPSSLIKRAICNLLVSSVPDYTPRPTRPRDPDQGAETAESDPAESDAPGRGTSGARRAQRRRDLIDHGPLGVTDRLVAALALGGGHPLGEREHEAAVVLDLFGGGLLLEQRDGVAEALQRDLLELLRRGVAGAIDLRLRGDQLVEQLRLAVLLARLGVGLADRERLAKRAAALRGRDEQSRAGRRLPDQLPLLGGEIGLCGHAFPLSGPCGSS